MASTPRQTSTARTLSGPNPVVKPTLVFVGSQKGGVGKTTIARLILHWLEENRRSHVAFDTEVPFGSLIRFYREKTELADIDQVAAQMRIFDAAYNDKSGSVSIVDLRAGYLYNSWPLIDGALVPDTARLFFDVPLWRNFFENALTVQFDHRMLAYAIWVVALIHTFDVAGVIKRGPLVVSAVLLAVAVTLQAALGIVTLLLVAPVSLALLHQATAMLVLTAATVHAARLAERAPRAISSPARA